MSGLTSFSDRARKGIATITIVLVLAGGITIAGVTLFWDFDGDGLRNYREWSKTNTESLNPDTDGDGLKDGREVQIGTNPLKVDVPTADPGGPYYTDEVHNHTGESRTIKLDAKNSQAPSGTIEEYSWKIVEDPTGEANLSNTNSQLAVFHSPNDVESGTKVKVKLTVTGGSGLSANETTAITVRPYNEPPEINAYSPASSNPTVDEPNNQTFSISATDEEDTQLNLLWSGNVSNDGNKAIYEGYWDSNHSDERVDVSVRVEDSNGKIRSKSWSLNIVDVNRPPEINISGPLSVEEDHGLSQEEIHLDASGTSDPEGDSLNFNWEITSGSFASLTDTYTSSPTFHAPPEADSPKDIGLRLRVSDEYGGTDTRNLTVTVNPFQELAHKYMPTLKFEESESYYPIDPFFDGDMYTMNNEDEYSNLSSFHPRTVFIHTVKQGGMTYIEYWYYYVYSGSALVWNHPNDWEFMEVVLDSNRDPVRIRYGSHGQITSYNAGGVEWDGTHPIAYVDGNRHAMDFDKVGFKHKDLGQVGAFAEVGSVLHGEELNKNSVFWGSILSSNNSETFLEANGYSYRSYELTPTGDNYWPTDYGGYDEGTGPPPWNRNIWYDPTHSDCA